MMSLPFTYKLNFLELSTWGYVMSISSSIHQTSVSGDLNRLLCTLSSKQEMNFSLTTNDYLKRGCVKSKAIQTPFHKSH